jgi:transglutaminase-like putative cysteine protease
VSGGASPGRDPSAPARSHTRLRIIHRTVVDYPGPVDASYNEVRMTPLTMPGQLALEARVEVTPRGAAYRYTDYFGAHVVAFDTQVAHQRLEIVATSLVEVDPFHAARPEPAGWDRVRSPQWRDRHVEWLTDREATLPADEVAAFAWERAADLPPDEVARAVSSWVHGRMTYLPGSTQVHTTAAEAWEAEAGVCQDIAHVVVGALRSVGIPARYVSGYLHPRPDAPVGETVNGESHAWVEWLTGEWVAFDPTNDAPAGYDHVVVARGRDYGDVPPLRGVYSGPASSAMTVTVEVTRLR